MLVFAGRSVNVLLWRMAWIAMFSSLDRERLGIDAVALSRTVEQFNSHASLGADLEFGKGTSVYNRANGDPLHSPNPCLAPLVEPPFYGVQVMPGDIATFIGLKTDGFGRVRPASGYGVAGLYAAGNDAASAMGETTRQPESPLDRP